MEEESIISLFGKVVKGEEAAFLLIPTNLFLFYPSLFKHLSNISRTLVFQVPNKCTTTVKQDKTSYLWHNRTQEDN